MPKQRASQRSLQQQMEQYEQENPKIAQAMRIFSVAMDIYQGAIFSITTPHVTVGTSTQQFGFVRIS